MMSSSTGVDVDAGGSLSNVKNVILVLSGKGGVGKSTVAVQLAHALRNRGNKVGLLDIDLCGPSIPHMLNLKGKDVHQSSDGWLPVYTDQSQSLAVMSIGFLLKDQDDAVVWRGPKKTSMIQQFVDDVSWGELDYLLIDTPPGTSDEHITVVTALRRRYTPTGAVLVTTPQAVSVNDVRRELDFCRKTAIPVIGVIENMSGYQCPNCEECTNVFSKGGGKGLADECRVPFLGEIPLEPELAKSCESGSECLLEKFPNSPISNIVGEVVNKILDVVNKNEQQKKADAVATATTVEMASSN